MGLEAVKEEILDSANRKAGAIIAEAKKEAARLLKEAEAKAESMKEHSDAEAKKRNELMKKQELTSAELESKKMLLEAKKHVVEHVFSEVAKKLEELSDTKREHYMNKLLKKVNKDIEPVHLYCNKKDTKFLHGALHEIKTEHEARHETGHKTEHKVEHAEIIGGLIAENKDKTVRVDYSFETLLQSIKDTEMKEINKILFG